MGNFVNMEIKPTLTIAGSDSCGGAGIQADIKTMSALGCYAMSVVTAITAQNTLGVTMTRGVKPSLVKAQIDAVMTDIPPLAIKTGMLYSKSVVMAVVRALKRNNATPHLVVDPVMVSTSGFKLISDDAIEAMVKQLFPLAELVTPNVAEAKVLADTDDPYEQAERILAMGPRAVLLKGGDRSGNEKIDLLFTASGSLITHSAPEVNTPNTHGTGCTLSSAIVSYLANGLSLTDAVMEAKSYVTEALVSGARFKIGAGHGPVDHFYAFR